MNMIVIKYFVILMRITQINDKNTETTTHFIQVFNVNKIITISKIKLKNYEVPSKDPKLDYYTTIFVARELAYSIKTTRHMPHLK